MLETAEAKIQALEAEIRNLTALLAGQGGRRREEPKVTAGSVQQTRTTVAGTMTSTSSLLRFSSLASTNAAITVGGGG